MKSMSRILRRALLLLAALWLLAPAVPAQAAPWSTRATRHATCAAKRTLVRIDTKTCAANRRRQALVLHRACCANAHGRVFCKTFLPCPRRSPS
jgi:hypothetical protein